MPSKLTLVSGLLFMISAFVLLHDVFQKPVVPALPLPPTATGAQLPIELSFPTPSPPPTEIYSIISERPIFIASRRAPVIAQVVTSAGPPEIDLSLVGVIYAKGTQIGIAHGDPNSQTIILREGAIIDNWRVIKVERTDVILQSGVYERTLHIERTADGSQ